MGGLSVDSGRAGTRRASRRWFGGAAGAIAAAGLLALALAGPASASGGDVTIASFAFTPASVTVSVGDSVTWTNNDGATHTATGSGFDTGQIAPGASKSVTMTTAGTFTYHCAIHPSMTGTVVVAAAAASPTPKATARATAKATAAPLPQTDAGQPPSTPGDGMPVFAAGAGVIALGTLAFAARRRQAVRVRR